MSNQNNDEKLKVVFAPGCFDEFDGTPEELQELVAQIHQMAEDGSIMDQAEPVSDEEAAEVMRRVAQNLMNRQ